MKKKLVVSLIAASIALSITPTLKSYAANEIVSVKLVNYIGSVSSLGITITGDYSIEGDSSITLDSSKSYTLKAVNGNVSLFAGDVKIRDFSSAVSFIPKNYGITSYITINKNYSYIGTMTFSNDGGYVRPINKVQIEDYVKGVVPREMPSLWNLEALKAQSIAARTYVTPYLSQVVEDTTKNQVYGGLGAQTPSTNIAVEATSGQILTYNNRPISAVFSSSNGGFTASSADTWGGSATSYLPAKADSYDPQIVWTLPVKKTQINTSNLNLKNPGAWWSSTTETDKTITDKLKNTFTAPGYANAEKKITSITDISMSNNKDSSGRAINASITFTYFLKNGNTYVTDSAGSLLPFTQTITKPIAEIRTLLGVNLFKSTLVTGVNSTGDSIVISGKGFGHGVGMSQHGSKSMGEKGKKYTDILAFYYPGTTLTEGSPSAPVDSTIGTVVNASSLNLRSGPGLGYSILRAIKPGETVSILDSKTTPGWYKILYNGTIGYVSSDYISVSNTNDPISLTLTATTSLHSSPTETGTNLGTLPANTVVTVVETQGSWVKISRAGTMQWILPNKDYSIPATLSLTALTSIHDKADSTSTLRGTLAPQTVTVLAKVGEWYQIKSYVGNLWILPNKNFTPVKPVTPPVTTPATKTGTVNTASLNMRSGPGTNYGVIGTLSKNAKVTIVETIAGGWLKVTYNGKTGFVSSTYISQGTTPPPATTPVTKTGTVNATSLNMRSGAGTTFSIVSTLPKGAKVTIVETIAGGWLKVSYNGKTGFVSSTYISQGTVTTPSTTPPPVTTPATKTGTVNATSLNMRSGAGTTFSIVSTLPKGAKVTIVETIAGGWLKVTYNGKTGFVSSTYISQGTVTTPSTTPPPAVTTKIGTVNATSLNMRSGAGTNYGIVANIPKNSKVTILSTLSNGWLSIQYNGKSGYVNASYIKS